MILISKLNIQTIDEFQIKYSKVYIKTAINES